jgi:hypothetical protein
VLLATHDRSMIERVGGRVLTLDAGRLARDEEIRGTAPPELSSPAGAGLADAPAGTIAGGIDARAPEPAEEPLP